MLYNGFELFDDEALQRMTDLMVRLMEDAQTAVDALAKELEELSESIGINLTECRTKTGKRARHNPGVSIREELTRVSDPRQVLDRLAQENKPPG